MWNEIRRDPSRPLKRGNVKKPTPSRRGAKARARAQAIRAMAANGCAPDPTKTLHSATGPGGAPIRHSHWRYVRAFLALIERGGAPTVTAIAKELHIHRVTLTQFKAKYPWLDEWVHGLAAAANVHLWAHVERRHGMLAIQGSTASAEVYAKMHCGVYGRPGARGDPDAGHQRRRADRGAEQLSGPTA